MNKTVSAITRLGCAATLAAAGAACETQKSFSPTSPNVAGPIAGVNISAPAPMSPANGVEVLNTEPLRLVFNNASSNSERKFWYVVELAADVNFNTKLYTHPRVEPAEGPQTSILVDARLGTDATYYWRVKADDGANASSYSSTAHFDIVVPVVIEAPTLVSPVNNTTTSNTTPDLVVNNGRVQGRTGEVAYKFEVARDGGFGDVISVAYVGRDSGGTTTHPSAPLPSGAPLFWRVIATNGSISSISAVASFRTPAAPAPGPGPGPGPSPPGAGTGCGAPYPGTPESIVNCQRSKYGYMGHGEIVAFLRAVARDLNRHGFSGAPFGLLVKTGGNNCQGYSCDILCSGQGGGQRQWDVLGDAEGAQYPKFDEVPRSNVVVRPCEIQ